MGPDTILARESEPASIRIQQDIVLLSIRAGSYFRLNSVGAQIWDMLTVPRHVDEILAGLSQSYNADTGILSRDVMDFLEVLLKRQLVRVVKPAEVR